MDEVKCKQSHSGFELMSLISFLMLCTVPWYNHYIIPVIICGCKIWILSKSPEKLRVPQNSMERAMLGITLRDKKRST